MKATALTDRYGPQIGELPGGSALADARRRALQQFDAAGLPDRRQETWHYTDLTGLAARNFDYLGSSPDAARLESASQALAGLALDLTAPLCVFVDGQLAPALCSYAGFGGLDIDTLAESPDALITGQGSGESALSALTALNTAFVRSGLHVQVSRPVEHPLQIVYLGSGCGSASQQKLRVELAADTRLAIVQYLVDDDASADGWLNQLIDIEQAARSRLSLYRLQQLSAGATQTTLVRATLGAEAQIVSRNVELGGALVRNELQLALTGTASAADVAGVTLTGGRQHADTRVAVGHRAPQSTSRQDFRAIAGDRSRIVFNGKVTVHEHAQHIDARQKSDNLLLSSSAEIDTKPELEIYADQVACSHGATVGELSDEHVFYLRSRGIDEPIARSMLTTAFAEVILGQIDDPRFAASARTAVHQRLRELAQTVPEQT